MSFRYEKAVVGGTFDHFHRGHEKLLSTALEQASHVTIGLTRPVMYQKKVLAGLIQDFEVRKKRLEQYLEENSFTERAEIMPIEDIYGTTLQEKAIEAIFVTEENLPNVDRINDKRKEIGFPELKAILVPYVQADDNHPITSERIRKGEIDRNGFMYHSIFTKSVLSLPDSLRPELQKPLGVLVATTDEVLEVIQDKIVITVGDIISETLRQKGIHPAISIIDFKTRRHELAHESFSNELHAANQKGTINREAVTKFITARDQYISSQKSQTIIIDGEEDLLALPAMLLGPMGAVVLYGQFDQGVVVNIVTEELKKNSMSLLKQFA